MSSEYSFDTTCAGVRTFPREHYELLVQGLRGLAKAVETANTRAKRLGLGAPYERELADLQRIIQWSVDKLDSEDGKFEVYVGVVSIGSLRYLTAAADFMSGTLRQRRAEGEARELPRVAFRKLDRQPEFLQEIKAGMAVPPAGILGDLEPGRGPQNESTPGGEQASREGEGDRGKLTPFDLLTC